MVLIFSTAQKVLKIKNKNFQKNTKMIYRNTNAHVKLPYFVLIGLKVRHRSKIPIFVMFDPAVLLAFNVNRYPSYFVGTIFRT